MYVFCRDSEYPKIQNLHILYLQLFKKSSLISHHYSDLALNQHISFPKGFLEGLSCFFYISVEIFISSHEGVGAFWNVLIRFVHSPQQDYILNEPLFCYIYRMSVLGVCLYVKIFLLREYILTVGVDRLIDFQKLFAVTF